ncbi:Polygalacturonase-inhibiting protein 4 [Heracleum sosnowskyi]|uniref:Polygalacturonase-inhibiting protein 4 n=1 Tax=Heracleum sosnowskyi TaxID=360622 RepID=A0AAD8J502_9APIA|nr:Polygalacturonase-inhibiting protein 4 [Heracleum sosnowskyi]
MNIKYSSLYPILCFFLIFLCLPHSSVSERCNKNDKRVLLQIKKALNNPYVIISWNPEGDCCEWSLVKCDEKTNRVITLYIEDDNNLTGQIPPQVADLPYLETLWFRKLPKLTGSIPTAISSLANLKSVRISWTNVTGPVPVFFAQLKNLTYLDLSFNKLTGSIPPQLSTLPNLEALFLDRNQLTGGIPDSFGKFPASPDIYLSHNQLTGLVPKTFAGSNPFRIDLSRNKLQGDISFFFGSKKRLEIADFSRNKFSFDFSKVKQFPPNLIYLDLNHNQITGSLPGALTKIRLQTFNVSYNRLCGKIPTGANLNIFDYFHNRCLCGTPLPKC